MPMPWISAKPKNRSSTSNQQLQIIKGQSTNVSERLFENKYSMPIELVLEYLKLTIAPSTTTKELYSLLSPEVKSVFVNHRGTSMDGFNFDQFIQSYKDRFLNVNRDILSDNLKINDINITANVDQSKFNVIMMVEEPIYNLNKKVWELREQEKVIDISIAKLVQYFNGIQKPGEYLKITDYSEKVLESKFIKLIWKLTPRSGMAPIS